MVRFVSVWLWVEVVWTRVADSVTQPTHYAVDSSSCLRPASIFGVQSHLMQPSRMLLLWKATHTKKRTRLHSNNETLDKESQRDFISAAIPSVHKWLSFLKSFLKKKKGTYASEPILPSFFKTYFTHASCPRFKKPLGWSHGKELSREIDDKK